MLCLVACLLPTAEDAEIAAIRDRLREHHLAGLDHLDAGGIEGMRPDGTWDDIPYGSRDPTNWKPVRHLLRLALIARAVREGTDPHRRKHVRALLQLGVAAWLRLDPASDNYWQNAINAPSAIVRLLLIAEADIAGAQRDLLLRWSRRGIKNGEWDYHGVPTGQNLLWLAGIHLQRAALEEDPAGIDRSVAAIGGQLQTRLSEGIQDDWTFHQHGPQLYSWGYGRVFAQDAANYIRAVAGTRYAFPPERLDVLARFVLDGQRWLLHGRTPDFTSMGRGLARPDPGGGMLPFALACREIASSGHPRAQELLDLAGQLEGTGPPAALPDGNRAFWRSDLMVQRRPGMYVAVKLASLRTSGSESGNAENALGWHLCDGVMTVMRDGEEYRNVFPLWDWYRVPGTTSQPGRRPLRELGWAAGNQHTAWSGGVSDGRNGLISFIHSRDGITARKTWCFVERSVIGLICGLVAEDEGTVETTLAQCLQRGVVEVRREGRAAEMLTDGTHILDAPLRVVHDGCIWTIPGRIQVRIELGPRRGSWRPINGFQPGDPVEARVFSLGLVHGVRGALADAVWRLDVGALQGGGLDIVANTSALQAIWDERNRTIYAAMYEAGPLPRSGHRADAACVAIFDQLQGRLIVADPRQVARRIAFIPTAGAKPALTIPVPGDPRAPLQTTQAFVVAPEAP